MPKLTYEASFGDSFFAIRNLEGEVSVLDKTLSTLDTDSKYQAYIRDAGGNFKPYDIPIDISGKVGIVCLSIVENTKGTWDLFANHGWTPMHDDLINFYNNNTGHRITILNKKF